MCDDKFWLEDINILFNKNNYDEILPKKYMSTTKKLNTLSRFIVYLSVLLFIININFLYIIIGALLLIGIILYYKKYISKCIFRINKDQVCKNKNKKVIGKKKTNNIYLIKPTVSSELQESKIYKETSDNFDIFNRSRYNIPRLKNNEHQQKEFANWLYSKS